MERMNKQGKTIDATTGYAEKSFTVENELVSIIIPVFNSLPYLREALDSVINQTYSNLEIIIVDDGSTDGSDAVCDEYKEDPRVKVVHQENKGVGIARNTGLNLMTGDMVAFLDSDDAFEPVFVEKMTFAMVQSQADIALCKHTTHYTEGKLRHRNRDQKHPQIPAGIYDRDGIFSTLSDSLIDLFIWNKQFRSALWDGNRFLDVRASEEWEVLYKILDRCNKMIVIDLPLYLYRRRSGSLTDTISWNMMCDQFLVASRVEHFIENMPDEFSEEALRKFRQADLNRQMNTYVFLDRINDKINKKAEQEKLRYQIINFKEKIDISRCRTRIRVEYGMIRFCPRLFRVVYHVFYSVRLSIKKLTEK